MRNSSSTIGPDSHSGRLQLGVFEINLSDGVLRSKRRVRRLQEQPLQILAALLEHPGEVVTREELRRRLWPENTYVEFEGSLNHAVQKLRDALGDSAQAPRYIETVPRRGYRLIASVQAVADSLPSTIQDSRATGRTPRSLMIAAALSVVALAIAAMVYFRRGPAPLTERDEVLITDLDNTTGEAIFDDTLKTAVAVKISESPFLTTVSDNRVRRTLQLMQKPADEKLVGPVAREVCQRLNVKALLNSSIAHLGGRYVIGVEAQDCRTGDTLAHQQAEARSQADVLTALGAATSRLRAQLGESIKSVERFDTPLYEATTASLEALKAFSIASEAQRKGQLREAIGLYQRAVELDPSFALAYQGLGICTNNLGETEAARPYLSKAFALRERASEREKHQIAALYYWSVTGELQKAITTYQLLAQSYPRDPGPHANLGALYRIAGSPDRALAESRKALQFAESAVIYEVIAASLTVLNRYDEAAAVLHQALEKKFIVPSIVTRSYQLAFLRGDTAGMQHAITMAKGTAAESTILLQEAQAKAFIGQLREARHLYAEAAKAAGVAGLNQQGDSALDQQALVEAEFGNLRQAKAILAKSASQSPTAAIARARTGDVAGADAIANQIAERSPLDTIANEVRLPLIRAAIALQRGDARGSAEALRPAAAYDLLTLNIHYLAGYAHLRSGALAEAAADFQHILDHRGTNPTAPLYPLAYVGLARTRAARGGAAAAREAYEQFFAIWKNADSGIPILVEAKREYARLR